MPASPSLIPSVTFAPNLTPPAFAFPNSNPTAALTLAQLPAAGSVQAGTSTFISDSSVAYSGAAVGNIAVGGGANLCRVFSNISNWIIG